MRLWAFGGECLKRVLVIIIIFSQIVSAGIEINELLPDPVGDDDAAMPEGEWVELYNPGNEDVDLEGFSLYDNIGQKADIVISDTNTLDGTVIKTKEYLIVYMNGRFGFLNNEGFEKISLHDLNDSLVDEVSYSGSKEGISWGKADGIWQYGLPSPNDVNRGNKSVENSKIKIEKIYGKKIKWGDIIKVKLAIFKADTRKNSIKIWVESKEGKKVSEETKMNIYGKFSDYNLVLPVKIIDNCADKFEDGEYEVIIDGLDDEDSENVKIKDKAFCEKVVVKEDSLEEDKTVIDLKEKKIDAEEPEKVIYVGNKVIYESKQNEAKRAALFFMLGAVILLLLYYVWKK